MARYALKKYANMRTSRRTRKHLFRARGKKPVQRLYGMRKGLRRFIPGYSRTASLQWGRFNGGSKGGRPELKYHDYAELVLLHDSDIIGVPVHVVKDSLNLIKRGTAATERIGQKVRVKSLDFSIELKNLSPTSNTCWVALVRDSQANGEAPDAEQIYDSTLTSVHGFRNIENSHRYTILKRWQVNLSPEDLDGSEKVWRGSIRLNDLINYDTSAATAIIDQVRSNNFGLLGASANTASGGGASLRVHTRTRYTDN